MVLLVIVMAIVMGCIKMVMRVLAMAIVMVIMLRVVATCSRGGGGGGSGGNDVVLAVITLVTAFATHVRTLRPYLLTAIHIFHPRSSKHTRCFYPSLSPTPLSSPSHRHRTSRGVALWRPLIPSLACSHE